MRRVMHSFWKLLIAMIIAIGTVSFTGGSLKAKAESEDLSNIDWNSAEVKLVPGNETDANAAFNAAFESNPPADGKIYIKLTSDVTLGTTLNQYEKVEQNSQVYVNLDGHKITLNEKLCADANSSLIFMDTSNNNAGSIEAISDTAPDWVFEANENNSNLILDHINVVSRKRVIHADGSGNITIQNCNFTHDGNGNDADKGGAVYATGKTISITDSKIKNYNVSDEGGAIYLNNANLTIGDNNNDTTKISNNTAEHAGGGIYAEGHYTFTMNGGTIDSNTAKSNTSANYGGGGVRLAGGSTGNASRFIMNGGSFTNNRSDHAGGGGLKAGHYENSENIVVEIHNGTFSGNSSHGEGGAISLGAQVHGTIGPRDDSASDVVNITGNKVDDWKSEYGATEDWGGGGVFIADGGTLVIKKALVEGNHAIGFGGGVAGCSTGRIIVDSNKENGIGIFNNTADGDLEHGLSGGSSAKHDDHVIAKGNTVFLNSGFADYFCALNSSVDEEMLGGGSENWTGSYDSIKIDEHTEKKEFSASSIMGLTSNSSGDDQQLARDAARVKITGNTSGTHGGGILCNGIMAMGDVPTKTTFNDRLIVSALKGIDNNKKYSQANRSFEFEILDENYNTVATKHTYEYTNPKNIQGGGNSGDKGIIEITIPFDHIDKNEVETNGNIKPRTYYLHELDNGLDYETNKTAYKIVISGKQTTDSQQMKEDGTPLNVTNNQITNVEVTTGRFDNSGEFTDKDEKGQTIAAVPYAKKLDSGIEHAKSLWIGIKGVNKDDPNKVNADDYTAQFDGESWNRSAQNGGDNTTDFAGGMDSNWGVRNIDDNTSYNNGGDDKWNVTLSDAFTNKGVTSYSVEKKWDDGDNADGLESAVTVRLYEEGNSKAIDEVTLNKDNNWKHTWKNLSSNKNYSAKEVKKDGNDDVEENQTFCGKDEDDGYVANYKKVKNIEVQAENHPATVTVGLWKNGTPVMDDNGQQVQKTLNENNSWDDKFENLDEDGSYKVKVIDPAVSDDDPQKYLYDITTFEYSGTVVTNHHTPATTSYTVNKNWVDDNNHDGLRPESIKVQLLADGSPCGDPVDVKASDGWEHTWSGLTKNKNGKLIEYTVDEVGNVSGYEKKVDGSSITNTHENETTSYTVNKNWDDNDNHDGLRPESIKVQLLADGSPCGDPVEIKASDGWKYTWNNLEKLKNVDGKSQEITYAVSEEPVLGYTAHYNGMNITNTYTPGQTSYQVIKSWDDSDDADGIRPKSVMVQLYANGNAYGNPVDVKASDGWAYEWTNLPDEYNGSPISYTADEVGTVPGYEKKLHENTIINKHSPETTSVSGKKNWNDGNDKNRPSSIKVYLTKKDDDGNYYDVDGVKPVEVSAKNGWRYSFDNLQKYEKGQPITYGVREESVEGYQTDYEGTDITNTKITSIPVSKTWDDNNNQDGIRPDKITVHLAGSYTDDDGNTQTVQIENNRQEISSDENGEWKYVFTDLPEYTDDGHKITYTVSEDPVDGYETKVNGYEITNTHKPATINISGSKIWNDNDNQDGIRPGKITVHLAGCYTDDAGNTQTVQIENDSQVVKPDKKGDWNYSFKDLPKYAEGKEISYSVTEDPVEGYETSYPANEDGTPRDYALNGETITNTHTPAVTSYSVKKVWDDNDNKDGKRPESVSVQLKADNEKFGDPITLTEAGPDNIVGDDDDWSYNWNDLPMYKNGKKIVYSAEELNVDSHYVAIYEKEDNSTTVTNIYVPGKVKLTIHKSFKGDQISDKDKKNLTFRITGIGKTVDQNGNKVNVKVDETITYASFQNGSYTFYQLYPGEYTVTETKAGINGYNVKVSYLVDGKSTQKVEAAQSEKEYQIDVTDEYHKKPEEKNSADTSDRTNLPWSAGIFSAAMLIGITALIFRRRYN